MILQFTQVCIATTIANVDVQQVSVQKQAMENCMLLVKPYEWYKCSLICFDALTNFRSLFT